MIDPYPFRPFRPFAPAAFLVLLAVTGICHAQRVVSFPPPDSKPPPPMKSPPRTQASGEDTFIFGENGPTMRQSQERRPPPPTTLTVMYKVEYGEELQYVYPDGKVQVFPQWRSYRDDGYRLMQFTNKRLADGNNYTYATAPLSSRGFDPVDIPLLYMTGDYDFALTESEVENLRRYITDGGTILFNAARGREEFSRAVAREMRRVLPHKTFMRMPPDHPVFHNRYRIEQLMMMGNGVQFMRDPEVFSIDIGTRAAAILVPDGFGSAWSGDKYHPAGSHIMGESAIRLGVNLMAYVLGSTEYGRFLAQEFPQYESSTRFGDVLRFALARYAGSWNINPALQNSLLRGINRNTGIDVDYSPQYIAFDEDALFDNPLILMTGHYEFELDPTEIDKLRTYLQRGGFLFASAAAGLSPFDSAFRREIGKLFPGNSLISLPPTHRIFSGGWNPIHQIEYTETALRDNPTLDRPVFEALFLDGRIAVLYTRYDLFSGLNREPNAYARGVVSEDALRLAIAVVTYALSH